MMAGRAQFYAFTGPTLMSAKTTPFLQAFKEPSDLVTICVRGDDGAHASITITPEEALRFSLALGAAKFSHAIVAERGLKSVTVHINGEKHEIPNGGRIAYERLVELAGEHGNPTVTVRFGDRDRAGKALAPGEVVDLDEGASVNVVHTGNA